MKNRRKRNQHIYKYLQNNTKHKDKTRQPAQAQGKHKRGERFKVYMGPYKMGTAALRRRATRDPARRQRAARVA